MMRSRTNNDFFPARLGDVCRIFLRGCVCVFLSIFVCLFACFWYLFFGRVTVDEGRNYMGSLVLSFSYFLETCGHIFS